MSQYTVITFAPVQGFIEKSRKLRDLYGASRILSYLSAKLVKLVSNDQVVSPGLPNHTNGMPNKIILKGFIGKQKVKETLLLAWKELLQKCRSWIENKLTKYEYHWERQWEYWSIYTWEIFWGTGNTISQAIDNMEQFKIARDWTAVNWTGESSSITGTDAIAWPQLGKVITADRRSESDLPRIGQFYQDLACVLEHKSINQIPEGIYLDPSERLSIPELVKRLVTRADVIPPSWDIAPLREGFQEIFRVPEPNDNQKGRWTGWFMGDGDQVGNFLQKLQESTTDQTEIEQQNTNFSTAMREWGETFTHNFDRSNLGRIVYAGGDDFLGVIYSPKEKEAITPIQAYEWLKKFPAEWKEHKQAITVSVGFVWAAPSIPQRDVLQHCREAEKTSKTMGRDRVTIRVVFNSGQYVEWTCPWKNIDILDKCSNWNHIYRDLAQLEARHAFQITQDQVDHKLAVELFNIYFRDHKLDFNELITETDTKKKSQAIIQWIHNLIKVGWQICSDT